MVGRYSHDRLPELPTVSTQVNPNTRSGNGVAIVWRKHRFGTFGAPFYLTKYKYVGRTHPGESMSNLAL
jgi:hypothetical protein